MLHKGSGSRYNLLGKYCVLLEPAPLQFLDLHLQDVVVGIKGVVMVFLLCPHEMVRILERPRRTNDQRWKVELVGILWQLISK